METITTQEISAARRKLASRIASELNRKPAAPTARSSHAKPGDAAAKDHAFKTRVLEMLNGFAQEKHWASFGYALEQLPKGTRVRINVELIS